MASVRRAALLVTAIVVAGKALGFIRDVLVAAQFGAQRESDALVMAQSIAEIASVLMLSALGAAYLPMLTEFLQTRTHDEVRAFTDKVYTGLGVLVGCLVALGTIFAPDVVSVVAPGFDEETASLSAKLLMIMLPSVFLSGYVALNSGYLQAHGKFHIPTLTANVPNVVVIVTLLFASNWMGVAAVAVALLVGRTLEVCAQLPSLMKSGFGFALRFAPRDRDVVRLVGLMLPMTIGVGLGQINEIVHKVIGSGLAEGSVAALSFSNRLCLVVVEVAGAAVTAVFYPTASRYWVSGKMEAFRSIIGAALNVMVATVVPISALMAVLRFPIVEVVFQRGAFDQHAVDMTVAAFFFFSFGLIGFAVRNVLSSTFFSMHDTRTPMVTGAIAVAVNVCLALLLSPSLGIGGLALASSISAVVGSVLLVFALKRRLGRLGLRTLVIEGLKVVVATLVLILVSHVGFQVAAPYLDTWVALVLATLESVISYYLVGVALRLNVACTLRDTVKRLVAGLGRSGG